jgi:hypothetical protein
VIQVENDSSLWYNLSPKKDDDMAQDSQSHAVDLEALAQRFGKLSEAEKRLLHSAPKGQLAMCGPNFDGKDPANDPSNADGWGNDREIRAEVIRWLLRGPCSIQNGRP